MFFNWHIPMQYEGKSIILQICEPKYFHWIYCATVGTRLTSCIFQNWTLHQQQQEGLRQLAGLGVLPTESHPHHVESGQSYQYDGCENFLMTPNYAESVAPAPMLLLPPEPEVQPLPVAASATVTEKGFLSFQVNTFLFLSIHYVWIAFLCRKLIRNFMSWY